MGNLNEQWRLIARPDDEASVDHFEVSESEKPVPGDNEVLVKNLYLFIPPSMRLWMNEKESYFPAQQLGEVMMGITLGVVEESNSSDLEVGTYVNGMGGWQNWFVTQSDQLQPVSPHPDIPLETYRTVLDVQGLTAYQGITEVCKPKTGETLVVTAAAGSVGSLACQIGKIMGAKVIGIAGGAEKCDWLTSECAIDAAIDYKSENVAERLDELVPEGIDMIYENVGGPIMDALLDRINDHARIALCGLISSYNGGGVQSTTSLNQIVIKTARIEGFLVRDYMHEYERVIPILQDWVLSNKLKYKVEVIEGGISATIGAMSNIFHGRNKGVQLVRF